MLQVGFATALLVPADAAPGDAELAGCHEDLEGARATLAAGADRPDDETMMAAVYAVLRASRAVRSGNRAAYGRGDDGLLCGQALVASVNEVLLPMLTLSPSPGPARPGHPPQAARET